MSQIPAAQLSKSGARGADLDAIIREQIQMIDLRLRGHSRVWGRNVVTYELPLNFSVPGLQKQDAQRIVYSALLRTYDAAGYETALLLEDKECKLLLAWTTDLDKDEIAAMNALIGSKRIKKEDIPAFIDKGFLPAPAGGRELSVKDRGTMQSRGGVTRPVVGPAGQVVNGAEFAAIAAEAALLGGS